MFDMQDTMNRVGLCYVGALFLLVILTNAL